MTDDLVQGGSQRPQAAGGASGSTSSQEKTLAVLRSISADVARLAAKQSSQPPQDAGKASGSTMAGGETIDELREDIKEVHAALIRLSEEMKGLKDRVQGGSQPPQDPSPSAAGEASVSTSRRNLVAFSMFLESNLELLEENFRSMRETAYRIYALISRHIIPPNLHQHKMEEEDYCSMAETNRISTLLSCHINLRNLRQPKVENDPNLDFNLRQPKMENESIDSADLVQGSSQPPQAAGQARGSTMAEREMSDRLEEDFNKFSAVQEILDAKLKSNYEAAYKMAAMHSLYLEQVETLDTLKKLMVEFDEHLNEKHLPCNQPRSKPKMKEESIDSPDKKQANLPCGTNPMLDFNLRQPKMEKDPNLDFNLRQPKMEKDPTNSEALAVEVPAADPIIAGLELSEELEKPKKKRGRPAKEPNAKKPR